MKVSLKWLRSYTAVSIGPEDLAHRLTMAGLEVTAIYRLGDTWSNVFVGEVTEIQPHPNADRLILATVGWGNGRALTVVTGAPNLTVGARVPLALSGARLIDTHGTPPQIRELKPTKLRGILSEGMVCSARELGLGDDHEGILILDDSAVPGTPLVDTLGDIIFDVDVTPNRSDCFSMIGIAREVGALLDEAVRLPTVTYPSAGSPTSTRIAVKIADPDLCPRYMASIVEGVTVGPSPRWLRDRLTAAGLRPINNIVDVTNYVMLEWGQPLHAFDYEKIRGKQIIVRRAGDDERITLLDGSERSLSHENLVIADAAGAIAVAGVMGGETSEVTSATRTIVIESANFNPISVRRTARALKQLTDAARRFERGLPRQLPEPALQRATQLMLEVAGGAATRGFVDVYPQPTTIPEIFLTSAEVKRILGLDLGGEQIARILRRLGCTVSHEEGEVRVVPPMQRTDLTIPADLCEEIARILGYDQIPTTLPVGRQPEPQANVRWSWNETIRQTLAGLGLVEIATYSLTSRERLRRLRGASGQASGTDRFIALAPARLGSGSPDLAETVTERFLPLSVEPLEVENPLSRDSECLRTTTFGSSLDMLRSNLRVADRDVHLFEIGRSYLPRPRDLPDERLTLTVVAGQYRSGLGWGERIENDFFWLKGIAEATLDRLAVGNRAYRPLHHPFFHPARSAAIVLPGTNDRLLGIIGEVEPDVRAAFDIDQPCYLFAVDLDEAVRLASCTRRVAPISRYPAVVQDVAVVVSTDIASAAIEELIRETGKPLVKSVDLFDLYQGPPIPDGKINLGYHITYQATDRTLTDAEVADVQKKVERALIGQLGADLRQ